VTHNKVNATLPKDIAPDTITLEQATALIDARAAKGGKEPRGAEKAKAAKAAAVQPTANAGKPRPKARKRATAAAKSAAAPRKQREA
jgi:DNA topoisomerase-1